MALALRGKSSERFQLLPLGPAAVLAEQGAASVLTPSPVQGLNARAVNDHQFRLGETMFSRLLKYCTGLGTAAVPLGRVAEPSSGGEP